MARLVEGVKPELMPQEGEWRGRVGWDGGGACQRCSADAGNDLARITAGDK